jgi:hypothetical protein
MPSRSWSRPSGIPRAVGLWRRRWEVLALIAMNFVLGPATAQEPPVLTGTWVGTWWMGKYEEPLELDLTQGRQGLIGQVRMWGYPRSDSSGPPAVVRAPVQGAVEGDRVTLAWTLPEHRPFTAELRLLSRDTLLGQAGVGAVTTGIGLHRSP